MYHRLRTLLSSFWQLYSQLAWRLHHAVLLSRCIYNLYTKKHFLISFNFLNHLQPNAQKCLVQSLHMWTLLQWHALNIDESSEKNMRRWCSGLKVWKPGFLHLFLTPLWNTSICIDFIMQFAHLQISHGPWGKQRVLVRPISRHMGWLAAGLQCLLKLPKRTHACQRHKLNLSSAFHSTLWKIEIQFDLLFRIGHSLLGQGYFWREKKCKNFSFFK